DDLRRIDVAGILDEGEQLLELRQRVLVELQRLHPDAVAIVGSISQPRSYQVAAERAAIETMIRFTAAELGISCGIVSPPTIRKRVDLFGIDDAIALTEPKLLEDITHDNIVHVYEAAYDPAYPGTKPICIYADYYPERSLLTAFTAGHAFSLLDAVKIARDML